MAPKQALAASRALRTDGTRPFVTQDRGGASALPPVPHGWHPAEQGLAGKSAKDAPQYLPAQPPDPGQINTRAERKKGYAIADVTL